MSKIFNFLRFRHKHQFNIPVAWQVTPDHWTNGGYPHYLETHNVTLLRCTGCLEEIKR